METLTEDLQSYLFNYITTTNEQLIKNVFF